MTPQEHYAKWRHALAPAEVLAWFCVVEQVLSVVWGGRWHRISYALEQGDWTWDLQLLIARTILELSLIGLLTLGNYVSWQKRVLPCIAMCGGAYACVLLYCIYWHAHAHSLLVVLIVTGPLMVPICMSILLCGVCLSSSRDDELVARLVVAVLCLAMFISFCPWGADWEHWWQLHGAWDLNEIPFIERVTDRILRIGIVGLTVRASSFLWRAPGGLRAELRECRLWIAISGVWGAIALLPFAREVLSAAVDPTHKFRPDVLRLLPAPYYCAMGIAIVRMFQRRAHDIEQEKRCFSCGYCLTGNLSGRCPECGWRTSAQQEQAAP